MLSTLKQTRFSCFKIRSWTHEKPQNHPLVVSINILQQTRVLFLNLKKKRQINKVSPEIKKLN